MSQFFVIRSPSTQEDEGRSQLMGKRPSKKMAQKLRDQLVTESKGYYGHGSFVIAREIEA